MLQNAKGFDALRRHIPIVGQRLTVLPILIVERTSLIDNPCVLQLDARLINADQLSGVDVDTAEQRNTLPHQSLKTFVLNFHLHLLCP